MSRRSFSLSELCVIAEVNNPSYMANHADRQLSCVTNVRKYITKDCALLISPFIPRKDVLSIVEYARSMDSCVVFLPKRQLDQFEKQDDLIACENGGVVLRRIMKLLRDEANIKVVGVTGSLGKTTTKDLIHSVLNQHFRTGKSIGNQNTAAPMLHNMQQLDSEIEIFVQEFGIGAKGIMPLDAAAFTPDCAVITCIAEAHIGTYGSLESILDEKLGLVRAMPEGRPAFLCMDDPLLKTVVLDKHPIIWYSTFSHDADYYADNIVNHGRFTTFDVFSKDRVFHLKLNIAGEHNVANAVAAVAVGDWFGVSKGEIERGVEQFKTGGIRQHFTNVGGFNLYLDCYNNSAPAALVGAIKVLEGAEAGVGGRKIAVIADIVLDETAPIVNARVGDELSNSDIDIAFCFGGDNAKILAEHLGKGSIESRYTCDREELNEWLRSTVTRRDVILFKGGVYRFLPRTVDQVFGTGLQLNNESKYDTVVGDHIERIMFPKGLPQEKTAAYVTYRGSASSVAVPDRSAEGLPFFAIGKKCFEGNECIREVHIPEGVTHIGYRAFAGCKQLRKVALPSTLLGIGERAFEGCEQLRSIRIPVGVLDIGNGAFRGCSRLRALYVPDTVGHIGFGAFRKCGFYFAVEPGAVSVQRGNRRLFSLGTAKVLNLPSRECIP